MQNTDNRVDQYIAKSGDFAKPVLENLRTLVHKACPDVKETIKWSFPHFDYKGPLCFMASFKEHCAFGFWKSTLLDDKHKALKPTGEGAMGHLGKITSVKDLPPTKVLLDLIKQAKKLNDEGKKVEKKPPGKKIAVPPDFFKAALKKNKKASENFGLFSPSKQREYIEWVTQAKTGPTKEKRLADSILWISEGKPLNWKYMAAKKSAAQR